MSTALKIICVILSDRINTAAEAEHRFSPSQAGFRRLEECVTQAACLVEALKRRRIAGLESFGLFIDLKKAYDMVPHEGLFAKLRRFGIRGRAYAFIVGLYRRSTIRVRLGHGTGAAYTDAFRLLRGVRQGCPLSCILFNIFINDLFDGLSYVGVPIPQGTAAHPVDPPLLLPGLLFADDALGLAANPEELCTLCDHIGEWTAENEMRVGISKCGIMVFGSNGEGGDASDLAQCPLPDPVYDARLNIGGEIVPLVTDYLYLGVTITPSLDTADLVAPRLASGRRTVMSLAPFLRCPVIPLSARIAVIRAVVLPRLLYGAEVYGMNRTLTTAMQSLLNLALRSLVRLGHWRSLPSLPLWRELGFRPICALAAGRRIRAFLKCQELSTWVSDLVATPYLTRQWTWVTGVGRWTTRHCPPHSPLSQRQWDGWQGWTQHEAKGNVEEAITTREESIRLHGYRKRPETDWYTTGDYTESPLCRPQWAYSPRLNPGIALIIRLRMGALATTARLIEWEKLPAATWTRRCPCCRATTHTEDIPHILLECAFWERHRTKFLASMLRQIEVVDPEASFDRCQRSVLLLGGSVSDKCLPRWLPPRLRKSDDDESDEASLDSDPALSDTSSDRSSILDVEEQPTLENLTPSESGCLQMASFLTLVVQARSLYIGCRADWPVRQSDAPFRAPGQRPDG
jgi:hypothetical protein